MTSIQQDGVLMPWDHTDHRDASGETLNVRQGRIDLSFHQVVGEVFAHVLSDPRLSIDTSESPPEVKIEVSSAPHAHAFSILQNDGTDILIGWFDGSHGTHIEPFRDDVVVLGDAHEKNAAYTPAIYSPYCIWAVPSYVPKAIVPDVPSLANPLVAARFGTDDGKTLQGITPGAGISRFSQEMIESYNLAPQGWQFKSGTQADCFDKVARCIQKKEWFVVPLWHPQYLHAIYGLRALDEPKGLLRPVDEARLVMSKKFLGKLSDSQRTAFLKVVSRVTLGNDAVTLMDKYVHVDKLSYYDAAQRWIADNQARVDSWFESGHADIVKRVSETSAYILPKEDVDVDAADGRVIALPDKAPATAGAYDPFSISSDGLIHTSLQLPWELSHNLPAGASPKLAFMGPVSKSQDLLTTAAAISEQQAYQAMRTCTLNLLARLREAAGGDLARIQLLRLDGCVAKSDTPEDTINVPRILDAASLMIKHALGPQQGAHARTVIITTTNPLNVPTMLSAVAELRW